MGRFWLKLAGVIVAIGVGLFIAFFLLDLAYLGFGILGATIVAFAVIGGVVYFFDRRAQQGYGQ